MKEKNAKYQRAVILLVGFLFCSPSFLWAESSVVTDELKQAKKAFDAKDYALCMKLNLKAAAENNLEAQRHIGNLYRQGLGVKQDNQEAMNWFQKAAAQGDASAECFLGDGYENGKGAVRNYHEALVWYQKSASQGNDWAQLSIGCIYEHGYGVSKDCAEAMKWYKKSAAQGNDLAKKLMAELKGSMGK